MKRIYEEIAPLCRKIKLQESVKNAGKDKEVARKVIDELYKQYCNFCMGIGVRNKNIQTAEDILNIELALYRGCILLDNQKVSKATHEPIRNLIIHSKHSLNKDHFNLCNIMMCKLIEYYFSDEL